MHARAHLLTALAIGLPACGDAAEPSPPPVETTLTVLNRTETELLELRVHSGDWYDAAPNLLAQPLADDAAIEVPFVQWQRVTVVRRRVELDEPVAYTTAEGLDVGGSGYELVVFARSFRLMAPLHTP